MDREIEELLQRVRDAKRSPFWQGTPEAARATPTLMRLLFGEASLIERMEDLEIPASDGSSIPARLYVPCTRPRGLIVFYHGGGWVIGSVADYHPFTAELARRSDCAVLSVDYRLAPEHPFPIPIDDAVAAMKFAVDNSERLLGMKPEKVIAMGDSAGATLATVASRLHNQLAGEDDRVDLQVLFYPVADADFSTGSYEEFEQGFLLTRRDMQWFWDLYCPDTSLRSHGNASPLHAGGLSVSPPALLLAAGLDPLRDEGEAYGRKLQAAGVPADIVRCDGLVHGFLAMVNYAPSAGRAFALALDRIQEVTAR